MQRSYFASQKPAFWTTVSFSLLHKWLPTMTQKRIVTETSQFKKKLDRSTSAHLIGSPLWSDWACLRQETWNWVQRFMPVTPVVGRGGSQKHPEFEAVLHNTVTPRLTWAMYQDPIPEKSRKLKFSEEKLGLISCTGSLMYNTTQTVISDWVKYTGCLHYLISLRMTELSNC